LAVQVLILSFLLPARGRPGVEQGIPIPPVAGVELPGEGASGTLATMPPDHLYCHQCGRRFRPPADRGEAALFCGDCAGPLEPGLPPGSAEPRQDQHKGRVIGRAKLRKRLVLRPDHTVYEASHSGLRTDVRVKLWPARIEQEEPVYLQTLLRRAAAARGVRSPNVVAILDMGRLKDGYFVMAERVPDSLRRMMARRLPLSVKYTLRLLRDILQGLADLEAAGAIHGSVDADNVLIGYDGEARLDHPGTVPPPRRLHKLLVRDGGVLAGPALYLAPERVRDERLADIRSDIYAAGAVAWHLMTGRPPFERESGLDVMMAAVEGPPPDPRQERPDLPEPVCELLMRLMATDPGDRPQHAADAVQAVSECVEELEEAGQWEGALSGPVRVASWKLGWTVLAVVLVVASVVPLVMMTRRHQREEAAKPIPHTTLYIRRPDRLARDALSPERARAARALLAYRMAYYRELRLAGQDEVESRLQAGKGIEEVREEMGAGHLVLVSHAAGLGRRNWTWIFANRAREEWVLREEVSVEGDDPDWTEMEETVGDLLAEACLRLGLEAAPGADSVTGADPAEWAAIGAALEAERRDALAEAERVLNEQEPLSPPGKFLQALYRTVRAARKSGTFGDVPAPPEDELPPEMRGVAALLGEIGRGNAEEVRAGFGSFLAALPDSARGYFLLGLWREYALEQPEEAVVAYRQAARLHPRYLPAVHAVARRLADRPEERDAFLEDYAERVADEELVAAVRQYAERSADQ